MNVVFIGCVDFSGTLLDTLKTENRFKITGIVTREQSSVNSDFFSLKPQAASLGADCFLYKNDRATLVEWMRKQNPDVIFCCGWSYLLDPEILSIPAHGAIGYHPSLLPRNRGRHPIVWALALGLSQTGSTFFVMNDEADAGDIVHQVAVAIDSEDDASSLYARLKTVASNQFVEVGRAILDGTLTRRPQRHELATYWRTRDFQDGRIDWRMGMESIKNLVRALTRPYVGAHIEMPHGDIKVWRVRAQSAPAPDIEPGRILAVAEREIVVKCGDGSIVLVEHEFGNLPGVGQCL